jgi:hypothetical protein
LQTTAADVQWSAQTLTLTTALTNNGAAGTLTWGGAFTLTVAATGTAALGAGTLTAATVNDVTGATHTHAITNTSDGDTNVSTLLSSDANGALRVDRFGAGVAVIAVSGTIALPDAGYIGNGSAAARLVFDSSGATDYAYFSGCNVGIGTATPAAAFQVESASFPPARIVRTSALSGALSSFDILHRTSVNMTDGHGPAIAFSIQDDTAGPNIAGALWAARSGADDTGDIYIAPYLAGAANVALFCKSTGSVGVGTILPQKRLHVAGTILVDGDEGGYANTIGFTDVSDLAARDTGVGTILFNDATNRNSAGFIKIYIGTTEYYIPVFSAI